MTYGAGFKASARNLGSEAQAALEALGRQALHAAELAFVHPVTGKRLRFESPLPADMARLARAGAPVRRVASRRPRMDSASSRELPGACLRPAPTSLLMILRTLPELLGDGPTVATENRRANRLSTIP